MKTTYMTTTSLTNRPTNQGLEPVLPRGSGERALFLRSMAASLAAALVTSITPAELLMIVETALAPYHVDPNTRLVVDISTTLRLLQSFAMSGKKLPSPAAAQRPTFDAAGDP
jgi:hypothetical protein